MPSPEHAFASPPSEPEHDHARAVDDFGFTGADLELFARIVAAYRNVGFGVIYAKHYAHGVIDTIHRHRPAHRDPDVDPDLGRSPAAPGSDFDIARRCADIFAHVYEAEAARIGFDPARAGDIATEAAARFRADYIDWLSHGIPDEFGIRG